LRCSPSYLIRWSVGDFLAWHGSVDKLGSLREFRGPPEPRFSTARSCCSLMPF
jgi:hypothetical protein